MNLRFSTLELKTKYDSDEDDILNCFHVPLLANSIRYDRAVGYFSSEVLTSAAKGLEKFIQSNGKMRLIIGDPLSDEEYEAVMKGTLNPNRLRSEELANLLLGTSDNKLKVLTYLIANNQLEIKFAFTHKGMFHKKIGIFYQEEETVVFSGSANETIAGLSNYNSEEISAFFSWKDSFSDYGKIEMENFNSLWDDNKKRVKVFSLESSAYRLIQSGVRKKELYKEIFPAHYYPDKKESFFSYSFPKSEQKLITLGIEAKVPCKPLMIKDRPFELFSHQVNAIDSWRSSNCCGLFKLATGAGKTFTSISAIVELYEERRRLQKSTFVVISVPYIELANQWVSELLPFAITPVKCYESSEKWIGALDKKIIRFRSGTLVFVCVVVVNRTLVSDGFQSKLAKVPLQDMLFIGDECHHLGGQGLFESLPKCKYRIGLSATPFRTDEEEVEGSPFPDITKQNLISYFKGIVSEYSLSDAIQDGILAPYRYEIVAVHLDCDEQELYEEYSLKISKMIVKAKNNRLSTEERLVLTSICGARARLLATCNGKLPALISYLNKNSKLDLSHSLIYVGEGKANGEDTPYIYHVTNALHEYGARVAKFTSKESNNERRKIMSNFKKCHIDSLVAMKVLDEGIDVPVCKSAFILASTRNPRQYVQRRGRVLRKAEGKKAALIVDFVVLPLKGSISSFSQSLRKAELDRIEDFKLTALNPQDVERKTFELGIY